MTHAYPDVLKKRYSNWKEIEDAISLLPTTTERGNAFEEFTFAFFTIKQQLYKASAIYRSKDIPQNQGDKGS